MLSLRQDDSICVARIDGTVTRVSRQEWRAAILPGLLDARRADPDALAGAILTALDAGFAADVQKAAEALLKIDPDRERRYWLPAVVFARNGHFKMALDALQRHRELYGETARILAADAEIHFDRNLRAKAEQLLGRSLELEPNDARALRVWCDHHRSAAGTESCAAGLEAIAALPNAWRARLLRASELYGAGEPEAARSLVVEALDLSGIPSEATVIASGVLARHHDIDAILGMIAPRFDLAAHGARCAMNILFALLEMRRKEDGEALMATVGGGVPASLGGHLEFYRRAFAALRDDDPAERRANLGFAKAIASYTRMDNDRNRSRFYEELMKSRLLVPMRRPFVDVPIVDIRETCADEGGIAPCTGIDSGGREVVLAFTDRNALDAWDRRSPQWISFGAAELLALVKETSSCSLVVNPAGPAAVEVSSSETIALLEGGEPPHVEPVSRFLAEPPRARPSQQLIEATVRFLRQSEHASEAWLFEMIDERNGVRPAIGILFDAGAPASLVRDTLLDAADALASGARGRKPVAITQLEPGSLLEFVRAKGARVFSKETEDRRQER